ncbi:PAS domain S-box protein [Bradyrhizobium sp. NBAIM01]|uniref:two-component system sensor histidine kinase NtrB n=1 Tax=Bradyrhizobium sp. NBAIM01 TaxID=2793818 RepID=UPI003207ABC8
MWAFFERLLDSSMLSPHGICLLWEPQLIWLHVVSDASIAAAYFSIPFALAILVTKRRDLKFGWVYWAFAIFIMACGLTHVLSIYTLWVPIYGIEGMLKAATAVASVFTAAALWPLLPKILTIPSPFELRQVQAALEEEEIKSRDATLLLQQVRDAQRAMRESVARLTAIVETAVDGVILLDAQDRILLFNPACERLFGYRADEVMNRNVGMLMPEADAGSERQVRHFATSGEAVGLRKDGTTFPMELSVGQARQDGELIFVGIVHDLTARKLTEQQLQQAQKMETVGQLSGGIAHDFNNLLTVIIGNAEHLSEQLKARPDLGRFADDICQSGERGAELTQRLLAFSRRQLLRPQTIDCRSLLDSMFKLLKRTLREDIEIRTTPGPARSWPLPTAPSSNPPCSISRSTRRMPCHREATSRLPRS